jgi:hypothetical protein
MLAKKNLHTGSGVLVITYINNQLLKLPLLLQGLPKLFPTLYGGA